MKRRIEKKINSSKNVRRDTKMENYKSKEENWGRTKETGNMTE